jgi:hypothetical protein
MSRRSAGDFVYVRHIRDLQLKFRLNSLHEPISPSKETGWNCVSRYGDIAIIEPFNRGSHNMTLVSQKMVQANHAGPYQPW